MKAPKRPKPTAQQLAVERRQQTALDKEIEEQEERFAAMARGQKGVKSLLGGVPASRAEMAGAKPAGAKARTMLGMGGASASSGAGSYGGGTSARRSVRRMV